MAAAQDSRSVGAPTSRAAEWEISGVVRLPPGVDALEGFVVYAKWTDLEARMAWGTGRAWPETAVPVTDARFTLHVKDRRPVTLVIARTYFPDPDRSQASGPYYACELGEQAVTPAASGANAPVEFDLREKVWLSTLRFVDGDGVPIAGVDCAETDLDLDERGSFRRPFGWRGRSGPTGEVPVLRTRPESLVHALHVGHLLTTTRCAPGTGVTVVPMPIGAFLSVRLSADGPIPASTSFVIDAVRRGANLHGAPYPEANLFAALACPPWMLRVPAVVDSVTRLWVPVAGDYAVHASLRRPVSGIAPPDVFGHSLAAAKPGEPGTTTGSDTAVDLRLRRADVEATSKELDALLERRAASTRPAIPQTRPAPTTRRSG